jgi:carotenoid 1,2-hydratase
MTERGLTRLERDKSSLSIGASTMCWTGDALQIAVDEICVPLPRRLRGSVRLIPSALCERSFALDDAARHRWSPIAPRARIEVRLSEPALAWSGDAYFDSNVGAEPLEDAFDAWTWSRATGPKHTVTLYDVKARESPAHAIALRFDAHGAVEEIQMPPVAALPSTGWRLPRETRADPGQPVRVISTLEDAPFYSRSLLNTSLFGMRCPAIHESLSLDRFRSRWVQCLLPFRMPRVTR